MKKIIGFDQEFDSILNQLIDNKLSNSLLLTGNKGIGKKYFILQIMEEYINKKVVSSQTQHHLSLLKNNSHPNIIIIEKEIDEKTSTLIDLVDLNQSMYKFPNQLSGGEQTRVCIARALASNPLVLLCDEPTGNLDPDLSIQIVTLLEKINRAGTTVLMATHDSSIVNRRKKRVIQLKEGKLISDVDQGRYI